MTGENDSYRVVFEDEETVDVLEALLRCTRILVKVGEIGKYSISVSSVDKVSRSFYAVSRNVSAPVSDSITLPPKKVV